jgi:hypothetical protein
LHAALVLRNAAIAFYSLSKDPSKGRPAQVPLVQNAYKMLQLADTVVGTEVALVSDDDPSSELHLYAVASSVVATMICVYSETGRAAEVRALEIKRRRLEHVLRQYRADAAQTVASE